VLAGRSRGRARRRSSANDQTMIQDGASSPNSSPFAYCNGAFNCSTAALAAVATSGHTRQGKGGTGSSDRAVATSSTKP
jgi:hypothetical protein